MESYLRNCIVIPRVNDSPFFKTESGEYVACLDGYAVIPLAEYESLIHAANKDADFRGSRLFAGRTWFGAEP